VRVDYVTSMSGAAAYEEIPYPGLPFQQTHPDRLALLAALHGLDTADPDACRVLEVGCGDGMNLVGMAAASPGLSAVGLDAAAAPLAVGRSFIERLGLDNIDLRSGDLREPNELGTFDYVVVHGVWTELDDATRDTLFALLSEVLAPHGVAYVSYTCLPGGRMRKMGRDVAEWMSRGSGSGLERVHATRRGLEALGPWVSGRSDLYGQVLAQELDRIREYSDPVLRHDDLAELWRSSWLGEVAGVAAHHGLQFFCEAEVAELRDDRMPPNADRLIDHLAGQDIVRRGEAGDVLSGRAFRRSLFCRADLRPEPLSRIHLHVLRVGPDRIPFAEWAAGREDPEGEALAGVRSGALELHAAPARYAHTVNERPEAFPLARLQAAAGNEVINLRHEHVIFDDHFPRALVAALDGTRDRGELADHVTAELARLGATVPPGAVLRDEVAKGLEGMLQTIADIALLVGERSPG